MKINLPKLDYHKILHHFTISIDFLFILFILSNYLEYTVVFWENLTTYLFYFVVAINTIFFASKINKIPESERDKSGMIYYFSHFFLLSLIIIVLNQFLKKQFIIDFMPELTAISIALGFLTFYAYRNKVEKEIEEEKISEERGEKKRFDEFGDKFPRLNRIWGLRRFVRWMYKEGWKFSIPLAIITLIFIAIKIGMPIVFNGSYIDEYNHIFSGIEFFKTGHFAEIYNGSYYARGAYVSFFVGLFMFIFGKTIFVAKMVPATIGIINFFLLYFIARQITLKKKYILLLMIIYTLSPWVIFNHFYIRMYVFYEFFILILTFSFIKLIDSIKSKNKKGIICYLGIFIFINLINYLLSYDSGKYMIFILSSLFILYFYLFEIKFNKRLKLILLIIVGIILWFFIDILSKLDLLMNANIIFTTPEDLKYNYYFFNLNLIFSIFFFLSLITIKKLKSKEFFIVIPFLIIFLAHLFSSQDLQILRGILYFFPAFYLVSVLSLSKLDSKKAFIFIIYIILLVTLINNYPNGFFKSPYINKEINYLDNSIYKDVQENCKNHLIITSGRTGIAQFFGVFPDYQINYEYLQVNRAYFNQSYNSFVDLYTQTPLIINNDSFMEVYNGHTKICYINVGFPVSWVNKETRSFVINNFIKYPKEYLYTSEGTITSFYIT